MPFKANKVNILKNVWLFSACTNKELSQIASLVDEVDVPRGAILTTEGGPGREFFAIIEGDADVVIRNRKIATLGSGQFFGEISLLDQGPRTATVKAATDMKLYVLDVRSFATLLDKHPAVARKILRGMAQRLRDLEKTPTH